MIHPEGVEDKLCYVLSVSMGIMGLLYLVGHFFQKVDEGGHREGYGFAVGALLIILAIFVVEKQQMLLALMLTYFYARKQWSTYSKRNLWMICIVDVVIAWLYTYAIIIEPINELHKLSAHGDLDSSDHHIRSCSLLCDRT